MSIDACPILPHGSAGLSSGTWALLNPEDILEIVEGILRRLECSWWVGNNDVEVVGGFESRDDRRTDNDDIRGGVKQVGHCRKTMEALHFNNISAYSLCNLHLHAESHAHEELRVCLSPAPCPVIQLIVIDGLLKRTLLVCPCSSAFRSLIETAPLG